MKCCKRYSKRWENEENINRILSTFCIVIYRSMQHLSHDIDRFDNLLKQWNNIMPQLRSKTRDKRRINVWLGKRDAKMIAVRRINKVSHRCAYHSSQTFASQIRIGTNVRRNANILWKLLPHWRETNKHIRNSYWERLLQTRNVINNTRDASVFRILQRSLITTPWQWMTNVCREIYFAVRQV